MLAALSSAARPAMRQLSSTTQRALGASTLSQSFHSYGGSGSHFYGAHGQEQPGHGMPTRYATTILSVRKDGKLAVIGDGQMTAGNMVVKPNTRKVRRIGEDNVIVGFAGSTADALALLERLESKLEAYSGQLPRACVELAKDWRTEKYMRRLEAALIVANAEVTLEVTGNGDVLEPADGVLAIGSGSPFATAAARALMHTDFTAMQIAERAMTIAGDMCVYTNHNWVKDEMDTVEPSSE